MSAQHQILVSPEFMALYRDAKKLLGGGGASRVLGFIADAQDVLDQHIAEQGGSYGSVSVEELGIEWLSHHMDESHRTVYRRNSEFRRVFPQYESPLALLRDEKLAA